MGIYARRGRQRDRERGEREKVHEKVMVQNVNYNHVCGIHFSDQMGNKGAFITLTKDLTPSFTSFSAVVS